MPDDARALAYASIDEITALGGAPAAADLIPVWDDSAKKWVKVTKSELVDSFEAENLDLSGTLDVTGAATFDSTVTIGGTLLGATAAEINQVADISAYTQTIAAAGAISLTSKVVNLALVGAGAVTLAAPDATCQGYVKVVEMTVDNGDVTLALTNVEGQSSGTTATFGDVGDKLVLVAGASKWVVLKEVGVGLA